MGPLPHPGALLDSLASGGSGFLLLSLPWDKPQVTTLAIIYTPGG